MKKVLVPLAQGCEELEAITIINLLRRAEIEVTSASLDSNPVTCARKTVILADTTLDKVLNKDFDLIVLPGGQPGADNLCDDDRIIHLLKAQNKKNKLIAAICAAPIVLAKAGLLDNKKATCFPNVLSKLHLNNTEISTAAIIKDGNIITSRGPGTAMEFALFLIEELVDTKLKNKIAAQMVSD